MVITVKKDIINWCNQTVDDGKELKLTWEGGGDSGWASLVLDDNAIELVGYSDVLLDGIYEELDYGSWAGEFFASGEAIYSKEKQAFIGIDDYREDEVVGHDCEIVLSVPSNIWYDSINIRIECDHEDAEVETVVNFFVKNGFISEEHRHTQQHLQEYISAKVGNEIDRFSRENEFQSIWDTITLNRSEGVETTPGFVKYTIDSIKIGTSVYQEKSICLQLIEENEQH